MVEKASPKNQALAATQIQRLWRGYAIRKYCPLRPRPTRLTSYRTFLVGNDPVLPPPPISHSPGKHALVGTSGLRALALLLQLSTHSPVTPKLIIVDRSKQVTCFWRGLRQLCIDNNFQMSQSFIDAFRQYLQKNKRLYRHLPSDIMKQYEYKDVRYEQQNPEHFLNSLIKCFGLDRLVKTIKHCSILARSWTDPAVFTAIAHICQQHQIEIISAYPSNIAHCLENTNQRDLFFNNVEQLSPALSVFTDLNGELLPERVLLSQEHRATVLSRHPFFPQPIARPKRPPGEADVEPAKRPRLE